jgi:hypothetical protein
MHGQMIRHGAALAWAIGYANPWANDSPRVEEVQGRQCHGRTVNFGYGRFGSRNALDLFKVDAKQLANFNVVKQDGIFGAHVKPEKKI